MLCCFLPQGRCAIWLELSREHVEVIQQKSLEQNAELVNGVPSFSKVESMAVMNREVCAKRRYMISLLACWKEYIRRLKTWKLIFLKLSTLFYHFESLPDPPQPEYLYPSLMSITVKMLEHLLMLELLAVVFIINLIVLENMLNWVMSVTSCWKSTHCISSYLKNILHV